MSLRLGKRPLARAGRPVGVNFTVGRDAHFEDLTCARTQPPGSAPCVPAGAGLWAGDARCERERKPGRRSGFTRLELHPELRRWAREKEDGPVQGAGGQQGLNSELARPSSLSGSRSFQPRRSIGKGAGFAASVRPEEGEQVGTIKWARQDSPAPGVEGRGAPVLRREGEVWGPPGTWRRRGWLRGLRSGHPPLARFRSDRTLIGDI